VKAVKPRSRLRDLRVPLLLGLALVAGPAAAGGDGPPLPPLSGEAPGTREVDWLQVDSGEWLRGELKRMHDEKLYFDSDEFDDVTLDWDNVASLIPARAVTCRLPGRRLVTGTLEMRNGAVRIDTGTEVVEVRREDVVSILPGTGKELGFWSASASLGLSARAGNTEQIDLTMRAEVMRQTVLTRFKASYTGEVSTVDNDATANSHRVPAAFDVFLTRSFFVTVPAFEYYTDEFQNIQNRFTAGLGLGYEIIDNSWLEWEVGGGAAYQYTTFESVAVGDSTSHDAALVASTELDFDLPRGIEWDNMYKLQLVVTDLDKTNHHAESTLSLDVWGPLELDVTFMFDRVEKPVPDADREVPESNDYRFTVGLSIEL
jgi:putative salt-induced outer membrane protein YdiY